MSRCSMAFGPDRGEKFTIVSAAGKVAGDFQTVHAASVGSADPAGVLYGQ